jgi:integrase/recombinase XerD
MLLNHDSNGFPDVDFWISEWFKGDHRTSPHTQAAYRKDVHEFLEITGKLFASIQVSDIMEYQSSLADRGYAQKTRARKFASVRSFYRFLNRREVTRVALERLESAKISQSINRDNLLSEKEVEAMIEAAKADQTQYLFIRFLYITAARVSEALALRWRDLTPLDNGGEAQITGKGRKHRISYLLPSLWSDLMEFRGSSADDEFLFPALNPYQAWELVKKLAKAAKIEKNVSPHSFRHAHISHALKNGATVAELRDQAGHANISTTSLYLHANPERATATRLKIQ